MRTSNILQFLQVMHCSRLLFAAAAAAELSFALDAAAIKVAAAKTSVSRSALFEDISCLELKLKKEKEGCETSDDSNLKVYSWRIPRNSFLYVIAFCAPDAPDTRGPSPHGSNFLIIFVTRQTFLRIYLLAS